MLAIARFHLIAVRTCCGMKVSNSWDEQSICSSHFWQKKDMLTLPFILLCRRSPISIAAAVIYMITQLSEDKKPLKGLECCPHCVFPCDWYTGNNTGESVADISLATGVAEGTIRNSYKDLYPYASRLIPNTYAKEEDLKNLCTP